MPSTPNFAKPDIPPPPSLPRFALPGDASDSGVDPLDVARTAQRPALGAGAAKRIVRRVRPTRPVVRPDQTDEVQVEDILLEAYLEDPPPPSYEPPSLPPPSSLHAPSSFQPATPSQAQAVDALLRVSEPSIALGQAPSSSHIYAYGYGTGFAGPDQETPSVAPVAFASMHAPPAPPVLPSRPRSSGASFAIWAVVLLVLGVSAGTGAALALPSGTAARMFGRAKVAVTKGAARRAEADATAKAEADAKVKAEADAKVKAEADAKVKAEADAKAKAEADARAKAEADAKAKLAAAPAAGTPVPTVSVDALSKTPIHPKTTLVVFPPYAHGHRVFVDGTVVSPGEAPTALRCGRRKIQIGSAGKVRKVELPCGKQIVLD